MRGSEANVPQEAWTTAGRLGERWHLQSLLFPPSWSFLSPSSILSHPEQHCHRTEFCHSLDKAQKKQQKNTLTNTVFISHSYTFHTLVIKAVGDLAGKQINKQTPAWQSVGWKGKIYSRKSHHCSKRRGWARCTGVDFKSQVKAFCGVISENKKSLSKHTYF